MIDLSKLGMTSAEALAGAERAAEIIRAAMRSTDLTAERAAAETAKMVPPDSPTCHA